MFCGLEQTFYIQTPDRNYSCGKKTKDIKQHNNDSCVLLHGTKWQRLPRVWGWICLLVSRKRWSPVAALRISNWWVWRLFSLAYEWRQREGVGSPFTAPLQSLPPHSRRPAAKSLNSSQAKQKESYSATVYRWFICLNVDTGRTSFFSLFNNRVKKSVSSL